MDKQQQIVFRQRECTWCRGIFYICKSCDRGHRYCSQECRKPARAAQKREASRRYLQSQEGRLDHRDRQRSYRKKLSRVPDQGSQGAVVRAIILPPKHPAVHREPFGAIRCCKCGRRGWWVQVNPPIKVRRR